MSAAVEKEKVQIERVWPAISALQKYGQRSGDIRLGSALLPLVQIVLRALREPDEAVVDAGGWSIVDDGDADQMAKTAWQAMIDHLLAD